jgi:hypothetical protein
MVATTTKEGRDGDHHDKRTSLLIMLPGPGAASIP